MPRSLFVSLQHFAASTQHADNPAVASLSTSRCIAVPHSSQVMFVAQGCQESAPQMWSSGVSSALQQHLYCAAAAAALMVPCLASSTCMAHRKLSQGNDLQASGIDVREAACQAAIGSAPGLKADHGDAHRVAAWCSALTAMTAPIGHVRLCSGSMRLSQSSCDTAPMGSVPGGPASTRGSGICKTSRNA